MIVTSIIMTDTVIIMSTNTEGIIRATSTAIIELIECTIMIVAMITGSLSVAIFCLTRCCTMGMYMIVIAGTSLIA